MKFLLFIISDNTSQTPLLLLSQPGAVLHNEGKAADNFNEARNMLQKYQLSKTKGVAVLVVLPISNVKYSILLSFILFNEQMRG